jgi:predicted nucleic acid-binding protein
MNILVDTCIFIDFFRDRESPHAHTLMKLMEAQRVALSPFVKLELLQGVRKSERKKLSDLLQALEQAPVTDDLFKTAEVLLPASQGQGLTIGLVDFLIAIQSLALELPLFTCDKTLHKLARKLDVELFKS